MEDAAAAASTSYSFHFSLAQAVLTISLNVAFVWISALIESSSSSSSSRRHIVPAPAPAAAEPAVEASAERGELAVVDLDAVLSLMGAGSASVGLEEAAALFEEEEATVEEAAAAFRVFDRDGDGFIDAGELRSVLGSLGFSAGAGAAECQRMIDAYDEDKDGRIDFTEFLKFMERTA
ncbi:hypothetical protein GUJ93_ZPchr0002g25024 [Zizania palustris]|uniref:EF-hand domain-containing protein n=1 Tax=Zizania palustris TaxID=103762 RepID=A0A8J5RUH1_ZIZPA|nr:hypothetical protein GUJ93_ZPchr0002g25024 [Zizania palustris]